MLSIIYRYIGAADIVGADWVSCQGRALTFPYISYGDGEQGCAGGIFEGRHLRRILTEPILYGKLTVLLCNFYSLYIGIYNRMSQ